MLVSRMKPKTMLPYFNFHMQINCDPFTMLAMCLLLLPRQERSPDSYNHQDEGQRSKVI